LKKYFLFEKEKMPKYWTSWFSKGSSTQYNFDDWITGESDDNTFTFCALIVCDTEEQVWDLIKTHFPDYRYRFCDQKDDDWTPNIRFI